MNLYIINYQINEDDLCYLEMRSLFDTNIQDKVFLSEISFNPTGSPFMRSKLEILGEYDHFDDLLLDLEENPITLDGFKVEYLDVFMKDEHYKNRREYCSSIGWKLMGDPSFDKPSIIYGVVCYKEKWYFGTVEHNEGTWRKHIKKPYSYSSSLGIKTARALANIAGEGDLNKRMIDPCCGVGTVLIEARHIGYEIIGRDLNKVVVDKTNLNLVHFGYEGDVIEGNIKDVNRYYDAAIVDLPYGILSDIDDDMIDMIIDNASRISKRLVLLSSIDMRKKLDLLGLTLIDSCRIYKGSKDKFCRYIWVLTR
jgi:tRNA G10  N-methylase Trm11